MTPRILSKNFQYQQCQCKIAEINKTKKKRQQKDVQAKKSNSISRITTTIFDRQFRWMVMSCESMSHLFNFSPAFPIFMYKADIDCMQMNQCVCVCAWIICQNIFITKKNKKNFSRQQKYKIVCAVCASTEWHIYEWIWRIIWLLLLSSSGAIFLRYCCCRLLFVSFLCVVGLSLAMVLSSRSDPMW